MATKKPIDLRLVGAAAVCIILAVALLNVSVLHIGGWGATVPPAGKEVAGATTTVIKNATVPVLIGKNTVQLDAEQVPTGYTKAGNGTYMPPLPETNNAGTSGGTTSRDLPPTTWNWGNYGTSSRDTIERSIPTGFHYSNQDYTLWMDDSDYARIPAQTTLKKISDAVYMAPAVYNSNDNEAGTSYLITLLKSSLVTIYLGPLDDNGKRNIVIAYYRSDDQIRYVWVGKAATGIDFSTELKESDFSNIGWENTNQPVSNPVQPTNNGASTIQSVTGGL
jgi:hypothetical protein